MHHDLHEYLPEMTRREKVRTWLRFYWWPTRRWVNALASRWEERRYGPVPPLVKDRVAHHYGFVEGISACTDGPICVEHGWPLSPLVAGQSESALRDGGEA